MTVAGVVLVGLGAVLSLVAAIGVARFPSTLARLHAATKSASLGLALIVFGAAVAARSWPLAAAGLLVAAFQFLTAPIAGHLLGRSVVLTGAAGLAPGPVKPPETSLPADDDVEVRRRPSVAGLVGLTVAWALLWQDFSPGTLVAGVGAAMITLALLPSAPAAVRPSPVWSAVLLGRYIALVVASNVRVAWEVVTPDDSDIREAVVAVPLRTSSRALATLLANAVSYTPGTLTIGLQTPAPGRFTLIIHTLHLTTEEELAADVAVLEALMVKALRPARRG